MTVTLRGTTIRSTTAIDAWTPATLFAAGEAGAWYDPSDRNTLFQDSAGTTPVTAVEQAVGLALDKSRGLVLGSDIKSAGAVGLIGTATAATYNTATGAGTVTRVDVSNQSYVEWSGLLPAGSFYAIKIQNTGANQLYVRTAVAGTIVATLAAGADVTVYAYSGGTGLITLTAATSGTTASFTISSFRSISGTHLIQPSASSRPVLRSRYNLLTYSEQFDNAAWANLTGGTGVTPVRTANAGIAPDGTTTADRLEFSLGGGTTSSDQSQITQSIAASDATIFVWLKSNTASSYDLYLRSANSTLTITVTPTWQRFSILGVGSVGNTRSFGLRGGQTPANSNTADILAWGADLRSANDTYLPYQRIAAATDYDTVGFPVYLAFDGSDDSMYTGGNLDLSGTDKVTVFAGVTKLSDAATTFVAETSAQADTNNGAFYLRAPNGATPTYDFLSRGTASGRVTPTGFAAPISNVITCIANIGGDVTQIRVDGVIQTTDTTDQGTGNYGSYVLNVGRRNNASNPFNGRLYQLLVRGAATSDALITQAERYVFTKEGRKV